MSTQTFLSILIVNLLSVAAMATGARAEGVASVFDDKDVWRDEAERPIKLSSFLGHGPVVLTMAYTKCQRTCPMSLKLMHEIESKFKQAKRESVFVILSLDPQHDTPEQIAAFLKSTADSGHGSNWHFLRGSEQLTERAATALGIDPFMSMDDHIIHKFKVWVFDAQGMALHTFDWQHRDVSEL